MEIFILIFPPRDPNIWRVKDGEATMEKDDFKKQIKTCRKLEKDSQAA